MSPQSFTFTAKPWLYPGKAGWVFVTLPVMVSRQLDDRYAHSKRGWGSLKVTVRVNAIAWQTSIFPDKKSQSYLLPLKASIRRSAGIVVGKMGHFDLEVHE